MNDLQNDSQSELQIELKIQRGIRDYEDILVQKIEEAFKQKKGKLDPSQYQNLVQVSMSTESSEVIKNFLRYQVGRGDKWGQGKDSLAEAIISHIQTDLATQAKTIAETAGDTSKFKSIYIELIRRYLGYGKRHLTFLNPRK